MSKGDAFPSIHGHLDVKGLSFDVLDAPSSFSVWFYSCRVMLFERILLNPISLTEESTSIFGVE